MAQTMPDVMAAATEDVGLDAVQGQQLLRQIMLVMLPLFILVRINKYYPFAAYLFRGLIKTVTPPTVALAALTDAKISTREDGTVEDFQIPANANLSFRQQEIQFDEIFELPFIDSLAELCLIGAATLTAPFITSAFNLLTRKDMLDLSAVSLLCLILIIDCIRILYTMLRSVGRDELMMTMAVGFFVFATTMVVWLAMGHQFTLSLDDEYFELQEHLRSSLSTTSTHTSKLRLPSIRFVKLATCMFGGFLAGSVLLAAMREARCHRAVLRNYAGNRLVTIAQYISVTLPLLIFLTYLQPLQPFLAKLLASLSLNGPSAILACRLLLLAFLTLCKLVLLRPQMQMYLNVAYERASGLFSPSSESSEETDNSSSKQLRTARKRNTKKAPPKTAKISAGSVQRTVENIWQYAAVVMLQLMLPTVLFTALGWSIALRGGLASLFDPSLATEPRSLSWAYADIVLCWWSATWFALTAGCGSMLQSIQSNE
eukprot:m.93212 g.93212  ORF g.93212 m.93212 type:complete len:486 (-) comp14978_c0_seq1:1150-2607(-)